MFLTKEIKIGDTLFSTSYGEVVVDRIVDSNGHLLESTLESKSIEDVEISVILPTGFTYTNERYSASGHKLYPRTKLITLFPNKEVALNYLSNL